jgi:CubicO group peptidase (beta-lactamase class C family)
MMLRISIMCRRLIAPLSVAGTIGLPISAFAQPLSERTSAAIDAAMAESIGTGWVAGGVVEVARGGQVVFAKAYGSSNLEMAVPTSTSDVFRIGSLTKQFTASAMLLLVQDGRLSLDDRVGKFLPSFPKDDSTTIRQLLNHTSGIVDYVGSSDFEERDKWLPLKTDELLRLIYAARPFHKFQPGSDWEYSSSNYALASAIIEHVSGLPLGQFLKERIFQPLGMKDTALDDGRDLVPRRASGYDRIAVATPGYQPARTISMTVPFGAGAMRSTARDLIVWSNALTHGWLLTAASYRQMTTPARLNDGSLPVRTKPDGSKASIRYGFGVFLSDNEAEPALTHDGGIDGFTSRLSYYPEADAEVVMLVNTSPSSHLPFPKITDAVQADLSATVQNGR